MKFDSATFSATLVSILLSKEKTLRNAAKESGVSMATLSRITHGEDPDIHTFTALIQWMDIDANLFIKPRNPLPPKQDAWAALYACLLNLGLSHDLIKALLTVLQFIKQQQ